MRLAFDILTAGAIWVFLVLGTLAVAWSYGLIGVMLWAAGWSVFFVSMDKAAEDRP